jgi:low affinity Fe/Cu permease
MRSGAHKGAMDSTLRQSVDRNSGPRHVEGAKGVRARSANPPALSAGKPRASGNGKTGWFTAFAQKAAQLAGRPSAFILAAAIVIVWGASGTLFGYSDTWQLVINTGTTIVTFLMVFLIQHSQNRDSVAFQVKLDELIIAMKGASNELAGAEDLCDEDLEALHRTYRKHASDALDALEERRGARKID